MKPSIDGTKLLIYVDDQPIACTTEASFHCETPPYPVTIEEPTQHSFTFEGFYKFDDFDHKSEELNRMLNRGYRNLPRKKKKAFKMAFLNGKCLSFKMVL